MRKERKPIHPGVLEGYRRFFREKKSGPFVTKFGQVPLAWMFNNLIRLGWNGTISTCFNYSFKEGGEERLGVFRIALDSEEASCFLKAVETILARPEDFENFTQALGEELGALLNGEKPERYEWISDMRGGELDFIE